MKIELDLIEKNSFLSINLKKNFGEVFTPFGLISEMLDKLPEEIWQNEKLRWLDPAAGNGNFFAIVFTRLMQGLKRFEPDETIRAKHIIENMLFFVEIQHKSCCLIKDVFSFNSKFSVNIFEGDYYNFTSMEFGFFDVIVGNPPYQDTINNENRKAKNHNLWSFFIKKSYEILVPSGYLLFITPPAWMSPSSEILKDIFLKTQLLYVNIEKCNSFFQGIGSKFAYFLLEKKKIYTTTIFDYKFSGGSRLSSFEGKSKILLNTNIRFIPQLPHELAFSILQKTIFAENKKFDIRYDSDLHRFTKKELLSDVKSEMHIYKVIHTPNQYIWSKRPHKYHGKLKVFIPLTTYFEDIIIDKCGNTQGVGYIMYDNLTNQEANNIKKVLLSKLYIFIANITRWSNFNVPEVMKLLPHYEYKKNDDLINDDSIFQYFHLTNKEIEFIKNLVPKDYSNYFSPKQQEIEFDMA